jgi:cyclophilin family peptidyl-prolyl cis-trans isomerase
MFYSAFELLHGRRARFFEDEIHDDVRHNAIGLLSMDNKARANTNSSRFAITVSDGRGDTVGAASLRRRDDGNHTIFGVLVAGIDAVHRIAAMATAPPPARPYRPLKAATIRASKECESVCLFQCHTSYIAHAR